MSYNKREIDKIIVTNYIGKELYFFSTVESTNETAKEFAKNGALHGSVVVSKMQLKGKGRDGRLWVSENNQGIYMSLILRPDLEAQRARLITIIAALAVEDALLDICHIKADIKWPNDILFKGKKMCGILSEIAFCNNIIKYVITGIGINVNNDFFDKEINDTAISIKQASGKKYEREKILVAVLEKFEKYYEILIKENTDFIISMYKKKCISIGSLLKVIYNNKTEVGTGIDIDTEGNLHVKKSNGEIIRVCSQEASIRGLNNYLGFNDMEEIKNDFSN